MKMDFVFRVCAMPVETATSWGVDKAKVIKAVDIALEHGRRDIAEVMVERAERDAQKPVTKPGVSEDSPKYESIKADLERR
jgi:hypothetical protein